MENKTFEELLELFCYSDSKEEVKKAANLLEWRYNFELYCSEMDKTVRFAHHGRGCTIVAAKLCKGVVIYQNVTLGSNMRYNKRLSIWENIGNPILADNVIVSDGAKILGPIIIGENTVIGAGAIITKDVPANSVAYGVNQFKPKNPDYDLVFNNNMVSRKLNIEANETLVERFNKSKKHH
ncbi:serine O-acetyltransferase [Vagococcus intermedius]|uniref:Serine acetyltransferase n=1 Tax=Vagococcus intermedius TaxID=2991418 RepID=A0AAF0CT37_9ENTE|nr:serine acetyltransferase [Vagococcus intermedius]WEG72386.1 serine acetyltransferase [Vagococcus intermedius]WEG74474.1 serine acetyltransferase [Vagococcus intermedius]